jgi:hypothetical protein
MNPSQDKDLAAVRDMFTDLLRLPEGNRFISGMMSGLDLIWGTFCQGGRVKRRPQPSSWPPLR